MSKKQRIIVLIIILILFTVLIAIIAILQHANNKQLLDEKNNNIQYISQNTTETTEDNTELSNKPTELYLDDKIVFNVDRLTNEQYADKTAMFAKVMSRSNLDTIQHGKVISEDILESSTEFQIFIECTFEDQTKLIYVCMYDATKMHKFLRCVSYEEWEAIENGSNAG